MLDYVLNITGKDKLFYVGHSQGTVMGFAGFTFNQTLAQHIQGFFALAPVATVQHVKGLFELIADISKPLSVSPLEPLNNRLRTSE
jgi:pimeloyl-ACP methyl ester carboxylesterase